MFNSVLKKVKKALGTDVNQGVIQNFPDYSEMVEGFNIGNGLVYSAVYTQSSTDAPALKTDYTVLNPHGLTTTIGRTSAGLYTIAFAFAGIKTIDAPALARLRLRVFNHKTGKLIESAALTISTTTVTATIQVLNIASIAGATLVVADLAGDFSLELHML